MPAPVAPSPVAAPTQGWKQKLFGPAMSDQSMEQNPDIARAWAGRQAEFPEAASSVMSVQPMSTLRKMLSNNAYGYTSPMGQIKINLDQVRADNQDINDVMMHEMEHARQGTGSYFSNLFSSKPEEAAINKEALRKVRRNDIYLPSPPIAQQITKVKK